MVSLDQDPYYLVEKDIIISIKGLISAYNNWDNLLLEKQTEYKNKEFKWYDKEIKRLIEIIEQDLNCITETFKVIEKFPNKFNNLINENELKRRKLFVNDTNLKINEIKYNLKCKSNNNNIYLGTSILDNISAKKEENQLQLYEKQDEYLGELMKNIQDVGEIAKIINKEIKYQTAILDSLDDRTNKSNDTISNIMMKLNKFYKSIR